MGLPSFAFVALALLIKLGCDLTRQGPTAALHEAAMRGELDVIVPACRPLSVDEVPGFGDDAEAASVSARLFGFAPESAAPSRAARAGVAVSTVAIQLGVSGSSPGLGRLVHCFAAIARKRTPIAIFSQSR